MINCKIVEFDALVKDTSFWNTVFGLVTDESDFLSVLNHIATSELHQVYNDEKPIGFFTLERHAPDVVEIHAFINAEDRRNSIQALRFMEKSQDSSIITSVWGTHAHVGKILERLGFSQVFVEDRGIVKGGEVYPLYYFYKEKMNGK